MRLNPAAEPSGVRACPQCGIRFRCGAEAGEERCWCVDYPAVAIDAALPGCLCPACLEERAEGTVGTPPPAPPSPPNSAIPTRRR